MARIFISHASEDHEIAGRLHQWLVTEGHEVFLDQDLRDGMKVGEEWSRRIYERLRWADAVVCVVTSAYAASAWCSAEVGVAQSLDSRLLPVRAEPDVAHPLLNSTHYADLTRKPTAARAALVEALRRIDAAGGLGWPDDRSPFPGLRSFDVEDHRVFFGRNAEVGQLAGLLRSPAGSAEEAVLLVVGPSGCGKSSLVRAGLLHVIAEEPGWWTLPPMLPGADPVAALARELTAAARQLGLSWTVAQVRHQLNDTGLTGLADELLLAAPSGQQQRLLVVVDQFDELLTQAPEEQRARFAELLVPALSGRVRSVATLRPESLNRLLLDSKLAALPTHTYTLRPLCREALRIVIKDPAQLAGIGIEDDLVARLVSDTDSGEALPLLAFTLAQLADGVGRGGQLSSARYDELGRVQGALIRQADAALAHASGVTGRDDKQVIAGLLRLVTMGEQDHPTPQRVDRAQLPEPVTRELDVFVQRRLVTTDTDNGRVVLGLAHESFLSVWAPLAQAIKENETALRARRTIEQAATDWHGNGRPPARLWERGQLAAAVTDTGAHLQAHNLVTDRVSLSPEGRAFLRASIRRDRTRRRRTITALSVLLVLAVAAAGIALVLQRTAVQERNIAVSRQVAAQATELRATNPALATQLALAAYRLAPTTEARSSLLSTVVNPYALRLTGHTNIIYSVALSSDGRTLATASQDKTARLWDISDPRHPRSLGVLTGHTSGVRTVAFGADGRILVTAGYDGTARLWDVGDLHQPRLLSILVGHTDTVTSVAFSPDSRVLATASYDSTARLWNVSDLRQPYLLGVLTGHTNRVSSVDFSTDGGVLATASDDTTVRLWDVSDLRQPHLLGVLTGHTNTISAVALSSDGHTLATASYDSTARLWDVSNPRNPQPLSTLTGHTNTLASVAFSSDSRTLATGSFDTTARLWDVSDLRQPRPLGVLTGHTNTVYSVVFGPDGRTLITGGADSTARLWDLPGPIMASHTNSVFSVAFSPDGRTLATGSFDKTARLWDASDPRNPRPISTLNGYTNDVRSVAFSPDGHTLATGSGTARLWDVSDPRQPRPLGTLADHPNTVNMVTFSPDGHTLATSSRDNIARLWDIRDPHHLHSLSALTGHTNTIYAVAFSPDGRTLATGGSDSTARLWDISDPRQPRALGVLTGHTDDVLSVAFSADGRTLAAGSSDSTARLWDISDPRQPRALGVLTGHTSGIRSVAFGAGGRALATGSYDNTARLWDISDPGQPGSLGILTGHTNSVRSVAFGPDGHTLATASHDATARLWETDIESVAARICGMTWPAITQSEWDHYLPGLTYRPPCP